MKLTIKLPKINLNIAVKYIFVILSLISFPNNAEDAAVILDGYSVFRVDLNTGNRTFLVDKLVEPDINANEYLGASDLIGIAPSGDIFLGFSGKYIYQVSATSGAARLITDLSNPLQGPVADISNAGYLSGADKHLAITQNNQILIKSDEGIISINSVTGQRIMLSDFLDTSLGPVPTTTIPPLSSNDYGLSVDPGGRILLSIRPIIDSTPEPGIANIHDQLVVNEVTGIRTPTRFHQLNVFNSKPSDAVEINTPYFSEQITDSTGNAVVAAAAKTGIEGFFLRHASGYFYYTLLSDWNNEAHGKIIRNYIDDLIWDNKNKRIVYLEHESGGIAAMDFNSGYRALISDFMNINQGSLINNAQIIAVGSLPKFLGHSGGASNPTINSTQFGLGTNVTISGLGFGGNKGKGQVLIGNKAAKIISWSDTAIVFKAPSLKAKTGYILKVKNNKGKSISVNSPRIEILAPTLSSLSSDSAIKGDIITIMGKDFGVIKPKIYLQGNKKSIISALSGNTDNSVQVKIPKLLAGAYLISLTNSAGNSLNKLSLNIY